MKIQVLLFGILKDLIDETKLKIDLDKSITIFEFKELLVEKYSNIKSYNFSVAVNEVYQQDTYLLKNGDVVALIPPVSGG